MGNVRCEKCGQMNPAGAIACARCHAPLQPGKQDGPARPQTVLNPGQVVAGRYQVVDLIGQGGMGAIYRVHDKVLNETVALKTLLPQFARDEVVVGRFYNEARIARQLSHPNIVRVHDIGMAGNILYISMEYLPGRSLRAAMEKLVPGQRIPILNVLHVMDQLCAALEYAHHYTIHRDLKPENVMIGSDGTIKLMDFGISKLMAHTRLTMTSMVMGTPQYMSPEQFRDSGNVDARADIFSMGVLLYEVLTGNVPTGVSKPVSQIMTEVPPALDPVVARCLEANPDDRYQCASDLRADLNAIKELIESGTHVPGQTEEMPEKRAHGPLGRRAAGVALIVALLCAAGIVMWLLSSGKDSAPPPNTPGIQTAGPPASRESATPPGSAAAFNMTAAAEEARRAALENLGDQPERQRILDAAEALWSEAEELGPAGKAQALRALQHYVGLALWTDNSMTFVPPGTVLLEDDEKSQEVFVEGFFIERRPVTNAMFRWFASRIQPRWDLPYPISEANQDDPVTSIPFYYAQAYAAALERKVPSEAQWARAASLLKAGEVEIQCIDNGGSEWTRSAYHTLPLPNDADPENPEALWFGSDIVVQGPPRTGGARVRYGFRYENRDPRLGFRCVQELPKDPSALIKIMRQLQQQAAAKTDA